MEHPFLDSRHLIELAWYTMPFGAYKDRFLSELPEHYLIWYQRKGFPVGKLGLLMQAVYDMKVHGTEPLLREIRKRYPKPLPRASES